MTYWAQALKTFLRVRDQLPAERVCDLRYDNVRRDPVAAARHVYEHFGWQFSPEIEERIKGTLAAQASQANGVHRYDTAYFRSEGMDGFAEYCERFGFSSATSSEGEERAEAAA
jgi:Sulfotransferase family